MANETPEIFKTKDYDQFNEITSNREVNQSHLNSLVISIQENNLLHLNPIIVNDQNDIIDGQHRRKAAKKLGVFLYYVVDDKITRDDIAKLNSNSKNWNMLDYVNFYCVEKVQEYLILSKLIREHPKISISSLVHILNKEYRRNTKEFKDGKLIVDNYDNAIEIITAVEKVRNLNINHAYDRNFILALAMCWKVEGFEFEKLYKKLVDSRLDLYQCSKKEQYIRLIEEIYNKYNRQPIRVF